MTVLGPLPNLGTQQSPIALDDIIDADVDVRINWHSLKFTKRGDERKWGVDPDSGFVRYRGAKYLPIEWHVHFPAEHTTDARHHGEVHIVHILDKDRELVDWDRDKMPKTGHAPKDWWRLFVIGVFLKSGRQPHTPFDLKRPAEVPRDELLPENPEMLVYNGSLTTPPYSENVTFGLFTEPMSIQAAQRRALAKPRNERALQGRNRRFILRTQAKFSRPPKKK